MGYHVAIVRTEEPSVSEQEVTSVVTGLGFTLNRDSSGSLESVDVPLNDADAVQLVFWSDGELWAKNPSDSLLSVMIEIATRLGKGARVRGDEGETYASATNTFVHPHDSQFFGSNRKRDWKSVLSWTPPVIGASLLAYAAIRFAVRHFMQ